MHEKYTKFNPETDIPSLAGKVILVTGGTSGLGRASVVALARHAPEHIYFTGRNSKAAEELTNQVATIDRFVATTFIMMDMNSLSSVKKSCAEFKHDRLDLLMCNAGVMFSPPGLSKDGFESEFAINHLAHAMIIKQLLPALSKAAAISDSDVRVVSLTSSAWGAHPQDGITFSTIQTTQEGFLGWMTRYAQSKLANVVYAAELARRHPQITSVSVHPGPTKTHLTSSISFWKRTMTLFFLWMTGEQFVEDQQGRLSQLWVSAGAARGELLNGGYYVPVGELSVDKLDDIAKSERLASDLWEFTEDVLAKF